MTTTASGGRETCWRQETVPVIALAAGAATGNELVMWHFSASILGFAGSELSARNPSSPVLDQTTEPSAYFVVEADCTSFMLKIRSFSVRRAAVVSNRITTLAPSAQRYVRR